MICISEKQKYFAGKSGIVPGRACGFDPPKSCETADQSTMRFRRELINLERTADVRFGAHNGLKSDGPMSEKCQQRKSRSSYHLVIQRRAAGSHGQSGSPACRNPSADLEYAQEAVRNIGVIVGEEPCCIAPMTLKPWRS